jgi:hypothetical protein
MASSAASPGRLQKSRGFLRKRDASLKLTFCSGHFRGG